MPRKMSVGGVMSSGVAVDEAVDGVIGQVRAVSSGGGTDGNMIWRITLSKESVREIVKIHLGRGIDVCVSSH